MTFAYWMLIAAAMMPYLTIALAKSAGGIDNRAPRPTLESLSGWRQRADWAHRNHFEAFPAFAAAVFVAELTHAPQTRIDQWPAFSCFCACSIRHCTLLIRPPCGQSSGRLALSLYSGCSCSAFEARRRIPTGHSALFADVVDSGGTQILGRLDLDSLLRAAVPCVSDPDNAPDEHPGRAHP